MMPATATTTTTATPAPSINGLPPVQEQIEERSAASRKAKRKTKKKNDSRKKRAKEAKDAAATAIAAAGPPSPPPVREEGRAPNPAPPPHAHPADALNDNAIEADGNADGDDDEVKSISAQGNQMRNGALVVNGIIGQLRPSSAASQCEDAMAENGQETGRSGSGKYTKDGILFGVWSLMTLTLADTPAPVDTQQSSAGPQSLLSGANNNALSVTSISQPEESARSVFARHGFYFGNHQDSQGSTPSHTPGYHPGFPLHQPYPRYPRTPAGPYGQSYHPAPGYLGYPPHPSPFHAPRAVPGSISPGDPREQPTPYVPSRYGPPDYYPVYGLPLHNHPMSRDSTSYSSRDARAQAEDDHEPWHGNPPRAYTPDTAPSDTKAPRAGSEGHQGREEGLELTVENAVVNGERMKKYAETVEASDSGASVRSDGSKIATHVEKTGHEEAPVTPTNVEPHYHDIDLLTAHLLRALKSEEYADYQVLLDSPASRFYPVSRLAHGIILSRSHSLSPRMKYIERHGCPRLLKASAGSSFVQPKAFEIALQNMYGLPLVDPNLLYGQTFLSLGYECSPRNYGGDIPSSSVDRMNFALCYAASGAFLADKDILRHGIHLAGNEIDWDTIETALRFGFDTASFALICPDDGESEPEAYGNGSINSHRSVPSDITQSDTAPIPPNCSPYTLNQELIGGWGPVMLQKALEILAEKLPFELELDPGAQPTLMPDRFPEIPSLSRSVSSLKFGHFNSAQSDHYTRETTIATAVLMSLPFKQLRKLFKFMRSKGKLTAKLAETIVAKRERRRIRAVRVFTSSAEHVDMPIPESFGWEEAVKFCDDERPYAQVSLLKSWRGLYTPPMEFGLDVSPTR